MKKNEFHKIIKQFYIKGNTTKEIKAELDEVHGTSALSFKAVYNWVNEFKRALLEICRIFPTHYWGKFHILG